MKKKILTDTGLVIDQNDLNGLDLTGLIKNISYVFDIAAKKGYDNCKIYTNYYGYNGECTLEIRGERDETDAEYKNRINQIKKAEEHRENKEKDERALLARLKKKYEK